MEQTAHLLKDFQEVPGKAVLLRKTSVLLHQSMESEII